MSTKYLKKDEVYVETQNGQEVYVFDPYNSLNKEITAPEVEKILHKYNVKLSIHNFTLYKRAFVHRSYIRKPFEMNQKNNIIIKENVEHCPELYTKSNERLEFLGDGVLECITKFYLYKRFPKSDEGFMTDTKIELVKNETIGRIAMEIGLQKWFMISKCTEQKNLRQNHKKLGCLFEAFIGALFLDFNRISIHDEEKWFSNHFLCGPGFQVAQLFVEAIFDNHIDWTKITKQSDNFKRPLQELLQSEFKTTPYVMEMDVYSSDQGYHMGVYLCLGQPTHGVTHKQTIHYTKYHSFKEIHKYMATHHRIFLYLGEGIHKMKQHAEQLACKEAIRNLKSYPDFQDVVDKVQQKHNVFETYM